jgi:Leucine-rich repeat (LRR) protein
VLIEIPNDIEKLKHLKELYLQSNNLRALPPCLASLDLFGDKSIFSLDNNQWIEEIEDCLNLSINRLHVLLNSDAYKK